MNTRLQKLEKKIILELSLEEMLILGHIARGKSNKWIEERNQCWKETIPGLRIPKVEDALVQIYKVLNVEHYGTEEKRRERAGGIYRKYCALGHAEVQKKRGVKSKENPDGPVRSISHLLTKVRNKAFVPEPAE